MTDESNDTAATDSSAAHSPSAPPRQERRGKNGTPGTYAPAETRRALLNSAIDLFERKGFAETSVQAIADNAGLTKGAFYHHFEQKEEVLYAIQSEYIDFQVTEVQAVLAADDDPVIQLRALVHLSVEAVGTHRSQVAVFLQERRYLTGERFDEVRDRRDIVEQYFVDVIRRGVAQGRFRANKDPRVVAFAILGMSAWVQQWFDEGGRWTIDDVSEMFWDLIANGLVVDG